MTPAGLLFIIALFLVARIAIGSPRAIALLDRRASVNNESGSYENEPLSNVVREYLDAFIMAGIAALFLITFVVRTFFIPSESMIPTLLVHDVLLVSEFEYRFGDPHSGDIAVFTPPIPAPSDFIKRVIGVPGDTLRIQDGVVYRNGKALDEPYILQRPAYDLDVKNYGVYVDGVRLDPDNANIPPRSKWSAPDRIPAGCFLMFGDNRNDSQDSHIWGFAQPRGLFMAGPLAGKPAQFTGHAIFVFWPLERIHVLH